MLNSSRSKASSPNISDDDAYRMLEGHLKLRQEAFDQLVEAFNDQDDVKIARFLSSMNTQQTFVFALKRRLAGKPPIDRTIKAPWEFL